MEKNSFLMYTDWLSMIEELDNEQRGVLFLAIMRYQSDREIPEMKKGSGEKIAFAHFCTQFLKDQEKYNKTVASRSAAGKLGGRPKANISDEKQKKQMLFEESNEKQSEAKKADNDNDNVNDIKENTLKGVKEKRFAPPTPENVSEYCREMGYTHVDADRFVDFYSAKGWMVGKSKMKDWKAAVRNWERQDKEQRQGVTAKVQNTNRFKNFTERQYNQSDYDKIIFGELTRGEEHT